jgi:hypothetical protein
MPDPEVKLTLVRGGPCPDTRTCPAVYKSNRRTVLIVGKIVTDPAVLAQAAVGPGEVLSEIPEELLPEVADGEV